ncbi:hypothetical protein KC361_g4259 [Hortaea werneckii]|nr:hypothetical protein KC361_g4259 [Hortaea werneckii]
MSSSSTSHKRVASGDGTSEKKRKRIEEYGEKSAALIDDSDDEEDTNTAAPVDEAVVEAPEAEARFLRAKTQAIELEKERKLLEKETSEWRSKTYALRFACRHVYKNMAIVDKIVKENGGASSQAEADYLEVPSVPTRKYMSTEKITTTSRLIPKKQMTKTEAFPAQGMKTLKPRSNRRKSAGMSSTARKNLATAQAPLILEKSIKMRSSLTSSGSVTNCQSLLGAEALSPEESACAGSSGNDDSGGDVQHDEFVEKSG